MMPPRIWAVEVSSHAGVGVYWHEPQSDRTAPYVRADLAEGLKSIVRRFIALPSGAWHPQRHAAEEILLAQDARAALAAYEEARK